MAGECTLSGSGFRQLIHSAFFLAIFVATGVPLYAQDAVDWRKDLEFLRDEIPKRHKNAFHSISQRQFEKQIDTLETRLAQVSRSEVILDVARIVASIGDGHTQMFLNADEKVGFHQLPVRFYWFREGIYVIAAEEQNRWAIGKRVSKIGNVAIMEAITRVTPLVNRDNEMTIRDVLPNDLCLAEVLYYLNLSNDGSAAAFEVDVDGEPRILRVSVPADNSKVTLTRWSQVISPSPLWMSQPGAKYWYRLLPEQSTLYVQFNEVADDEQQSIQSFFEQVFTLGRKERLQNFVLDIRLNNGGDNTLLEPILRGIKTAQFNRKGHLFVITGRLTFSAAMNLASRLEHETHATFVGEPTGSRPNHYGEAVTLTLPASGITVRVSTRYWQDSKPNDKRLWIAPEMPAPPSAAAFSRGIDPAMDSILRAFGRDHHSGSPDITPQTKQMPIP
jgi:hypothetical protein